jgi:hypothetical protein
MRLLLLGLGPCSVAQKRIKFPRRPSFDPCNARSATMASNSVCRRQHDVLLSATTMPSSLSRVPYCSKLDGMFSFGPASHRKYKRGGA